LGLHAPLPVAGPFIPACQRPDHAKLRDLVQGNARLAAGAAHGPVALMGPVIAGLFVGVDGGQAQLIMQPAQRLDRIALEHPKPQPALGKRRIQLDQALANERPVALGRIGLAPVAGLDDRHRQHRPVGHGPRQWRVIDRAQVALVPDELRAHRLRRQRSEQ